jgi:hypothetical protein
VNAILMMQSGLSLINSRSLIFAPLHTPQSTLVLHLKFAHLTAASIIPSTKELSALSVGSARLGRMVVG